MTAVPIEPGGRFKTPPHRRTHQKVRRHSRAYQRDWFRHFSWAEGRRLLLALRIHAEGLRRKGERTGAAPRQGEAGGISFGAIRLAELLVAIAAKGKGRLEPSVAWLARRLNVPAKSVHAWKEQLRRHGFLSWTRRYLETGKPGSRGPQVHQTSNAYVLTTPAAASAAAERVLGPRGAAGDQTEARARSEEGKSLLAALDRLGDNFREATVGINLKPPGA
jgi:hypothetical protein